jgi:hypothetical protein
VQDFSFGLCIHTTLTLAKRGRFRQRHCLSAVAGA